MRGSYRKIGLIMNELRGKPYSQAVAFLSFSPKMANSKIKSTLLHCRANYENRFGKVDDGRLFVSEAFCTPGPTLKRFQPKSMGRAGGILKRTVHINFEITSK